ESSAELAAATVALEDAPRAPPPSEELRERHACAGGDPNRDTEPAVGAGAKRQHRSRAGDQNAHDRRARRDERPIELSLVVAGVSGGKSPARHLLGVAPGVRLEATLIREDRVAESSVDAPHCDR